MNPHLLVVDDDDALRDLLSRFLSSQGFLVSTAASAGEAREILESVTPDLIVLDVMMPGETGLAFAADFRSKGSVPILMLSARGESETRIEGFEAGVDDYLPKPFEPKELLLRIQAILRRTARLPSSPRSAMVRFGPYVFDAASGRLERSGTFIHLTSGEMALLSVLAAGAGEPVSRETLAEATGSPNGERHVDVQLSRLRRKLEADPARPFYLQTVRNAGYRLMVD